MIDLDRLRINVTSGKYVVDPYDVADALLCRAGIATGPIGSPPADAEPVSRADARSRTVPVPRRPGD